MRPLLHPTKLRFAGHPGLVLLGVLFVLQVGCGMAGDASDAGDDDDDYGDGDADSDADGDADSDADAGVGDGGEGTPQSCTDGEDNDQSGLSDCNDPGCLGFVQCCEDARESLLDETFSDTLNLATWKPFGDGAVVVAEGELRPSGDAMYESGVVSNATYPVTGLLEIEVDLAVPACLEGCGELIGVALTSRNDYAEASTVDPVAGLVVEKSTSQANLLLVINGAVEMSAPITTELVSVIIQVQPDRRVHVFDDQGGPVFDSVGTLDPRVSEAFVAIFGRNGDTAGASEVKVRAGACKLPSALQRSGPAPVIPAGAAPFAVAAARSPAVARVPAAADLGMLFVGVTSGASAIGHATSADAGRTWITSPGETAVILGEDMPDGWDSPDDPTLVIREGGEHVAVLSAASIGDASQRSLVFATSPDGLEWNVSPDPVAFAECHSVRHPELVEESAEVSVLFFTCEDADGLTTIRRADAFGGGAWDLWPQPVLEPEDDEGLEMDGVAAAGVRLGPGEIWEMWYEAREGLRRTLRYAASDDGLSFDRWDGTVFAPGPAGGWDDLQVGDPDVVEVPAGGVLLIYYTGLGPTGQGVGLLVHDLPQLVFE